MCITVEPAPSYADSYCLCGEKAVDELTSKYGYVLRVCGDADCASDAVATLRSDDKHEAIIRTIASRIE